MINSTPGSTEADSYVSVEYADAFVSAMIDGDGWPSVLSEKESALKEATRVIDEQFKWLGTLSNSSQSLGWPRTGFIDADGRAFASDAIPKRVKDATCNLAIFLLRNGGLEMSGSSLKGLKAGPISATFENNEIVAGVPKYIVTSLRGYGSFIGHSHGAAYSVDVLRC